MPRVIFSAQSDYLQAAIQELSSTFPSARVVRLAAETGFIEAPTLDIAAVARACRNRPLVFVRHLFQEDRRLAGVDQDAIGAELDRLVNRLDPGTPHALQVWADGTLPPGLRTDELWRALARRIESRGHVIERANGDQTISVCLTPHESTIGLNPPAFALADWPGGRVGLAKSDAQVSRSEFKLEELFKTAGLALPSRGTALDLGASPGGWTRILRRHGFSVWAVDPAALDPRVAVDPGVHHVRTTAGSYLAGPAGRDREFDLIVNDMRMVPELSCQIMRQAAPRVARGGHAIVTLKLTPSSAVRTVEGCLRILGRAYDVVFARQLFHNRNEVTVVARH